MSVPKTALFTQLSLGLARLTRPLTPLDDENATREAQMLAAFSLAHLISVCVMLLSRVLLSHAFSSASDAAIVGHALFVLLAYGLSRTRHYPIGAAVYVLSFYALLFMLVFSDLSIPPEQSLNLLVVPVFLASLTLAPLPTVGFALLGALLILLVPLLAPSYPHDLLPVMRFHIFVSLLIIVGAAVRRRDFLLLSESEDRYRSLMNVALESIIISDTKGQILDCNATFEQLVATPLAKLRGQSMISFVLPEAHERIRAWFNHQEQGIFETRIVSAEGQQRAVEILTRPCTYLGQTARVTVARDITRRKHTEEERREFELRYQALFQQTADAVFVFDLEGRMLDANAQAARMIGVPAEALIGKSFEDYIIHVEQNEAQNHLQRLRAGELIPLYERRFRRANGEEFLGEIALTLVHDADQNRHYVQSVVRDVSERKRAEQQAFELALQRERVKVLQQFINDASHHFRTPLANINTAFYLMQRLKDEPEKVQRQGDLVRSEIRRLDRLLEDLLTVIRLEKEATEQITQMRFSLNDLLQERISTAQRENGTKRHTWEVQRHVDVMIRGNPMRLGQAISHIIDNAVRYTPENGTIHARCYTRDQHAIVELRDTGIGMTPEEQARIFDYFYRTDTARSIDSSRNGLGLSISHKIAQMHRGSIDVQSEIGVGSVVRLVIPLSSNTQGKQPAQAD